VPVTHGVAGSSPVYPAW